MSRARVLVLWLKLPKGQRLGMVLHGLVEWAKTAGMAAPAARAHLGCEGFGCPLEVQLRQLVGRQVHFAAQVDEVASLACSSVRVADLHANGQ